MRRCLPSLPILATVLSLTACGSEHAPVFPEPTAGWVIDEHDGKSPPVMPVVEALAWRYDDYEGNPATDIWLAAAPLTDAQREHFKPARNGQSHDPEAQAEALGLSGLLVRVNDLSTGRSHGAAGMYAHCRPKANQLKCSGGSGLGLMLIRRFDATSIAGEYYTRGPQGQLYIARFDTPLRNESATPLPTEVVYSSDGGDAAAALLRHTQASREGDLVTLKQHVLPERAADYDDPGVLKFVQRSAATHVQILAAQSQREHAALWIRQSHGERGEIPGVWRVRMQRVDGIWRVVEQSNR